MIRKEFIFIAIILLGVFVGITIIKHKNRPAKSKTSGKVVKRNSSQTFWIYYNRATKYRLSGNSDSSITFYRKALRLNPDHKDALYYIGNMYMKAGKLDSALKVWKKLTHINTQSERTFNQLGNLYFDIQHKKFFMPGKSRLYFMRANNLNKEALNPNIRLGEIALYQNRDDDAFGILNNLLMMQYKNAEIYFLLGYLDWRSHKIKNAVNNLDRTYEFAKQMHLMTDENGGKAISAKNASADKNQKNDFFTQWIARNLGKYKKYDIKTAVSRVYAAFHKYLESTRKKMAHM